MGKPMTQLQALWTFSVIPSASEESTAFVWDCLSFFSANWQDKQLTKMILTYVVACHPA